jgi:hypothetical protein
VLGVTSAALTWLVGYEVGRLAGAVPSLVAGVVTFVGLAAVLHLFTHEEIVLMKRGVDTVRRRLTALRRRATSAAA